jgi:putative MATE family efflux protein
MKQNMTTGSIGKHLISFAIPMILGNLFQLTYNAADSIIVGRYAGEDALAAVGTSNPIMNIIIFFIVGICMGASVLMSEFYGAGDFIKLKREISTSIIVGSIFTIVITILCIVLAKPILLLINTPPEILKDAVSYLRIIFMGLIFTFFYNIYASTLRSMGDSKTPIYFVMVAAIINVGLDIVFVKYLHYGVLGAAVATVIAQAISGILCVIYANKKIPILRFKREDLVIDKTLLKQTISYSWFTSMQQTVLYIGKVFVQGAVNPLGISSIATFNAVNRVDDFAFTPQQSIAHGMTTFIAQNRGAKNEKRIRGGFIRGLQIEFAYWIILFVVVYIGAGSMMKMFITDGDASVVTLGTEYLKAMAIFYALPALTNGIQGYFRGMGKLKVTLHATTVQMIVRVIAAYMLAPRMGISGIAYACLIGWVAMLLYEIPVYIKLQRELKK